MSQHSPIHQPRPMRVICVGAGISGIAAAYKAGRELEKVELVIYEKNEDVGGTWLENRYPGCACDIPAHAYTFSWEGNPEWSRFYAEAPEIYEYLRSCTIKWDIRKFIKLRHRVVAAKWDDSSSSWDVKVQGPDGQLVEDSCNVLISATGPLNKWEWPEIQGLHDFGGQLIHPACWDPATDLKGKKVAVIGAGSSALQVVPSIQPIVSKLVNFIRSPTWVTAEYNQSFASEGRGTTFSPEDIESFKSDKKKLFNYRKMLLNDATARFDLYYKNSSTQVKAFEATEELMRRRLRNHTEICDKLIPKFEVGCRRLSPGNGYLEALIQPNAEAVFDGIREINKSGILTNNGVQYDLDVIICATGFDVSSRPPFPVIGREGVNLQSFWEETPVHYLSVAAPGFPNYFISGGPNAPISNISLVYGLETAITYAYSCIRKMQTEKILSMEVTREATDDFLRQRNLMMQDMVWTGSCVSWYKKGKSEGPVTGPWVGSVWHYIETLRNPRWEDYTMRYLGKSRFEYLGNGRTRSELTSVDIAGVYLSELGL